MPKKTLPPRSAGTLKWRGALQVTVSDNLESAVRGLNHIIANPQAMAMLLKQAASETILKAWRQRFYEGIPHVLAMERADAERVVKDLPLTLQREVLEAHSYIDSLVTIDNPTIKAEQRDEAKARLRARQDAVKKFLSKQFGQGSTTFQQLAMKVVTMMTDVNNAAVFRTETGGVGVGFGDLRELNEVHTPSGSRGFSTSQMNILWRHIEFGTGIYSTDPEGNPGTEYTREGGRWWYGPTPTQGVLFQGSQGAHAIFDLEGVPYEEDAQNFTRVVSRLLIEAMQ